MVNMQFQVSNLSLGSEVLFVMSVYFYFYRYGAVLLKNANDLYKHTKPNVVKLSGWIVLWTPMCFVFFK